MKKIVFLICLVTLANCKNKEEETTKSTTETENRAKPEKIRISDEDLQNAVIYEANIRQYSPEGTFEAFTKDIPQLKELGVKIIWLMPIHPISMVKRKAENDSSVEDIADLEERKKYLGSPYSIANYREVNPDFGTKEDFRKLVQTAHNSGMFVLIDWVPNHTGWDHPWIEEHPEFYTKNDQGEISDPLNDQGEPWGWTDVADLDYSNQAMRKQMIAEMNYWVAVEGIDGFRCDVAHGVPANFWKQAIPELRKGKELFMLAEAEIPEIMKGDLFEMSYAWERHHLLNAIAKGEKSVPDFDTHMSMSNEKWEKDDILMNFITNHDENSWAGPVNERMGDASDAMLALTYCIPGMPLIYSGQEYGLDKRLKFFEKDTIPKTKGVTYALLEKLGALKNDIAALSGGKTPASYERLSTSEDSSILAFRRQKDTSEAIYMANLSDKPVKFTTKISGEYTNVITQETVRIEPEMAYDFSAWEYWILKK